MRTNFFFKGKKNILEQRIEEYSRTKDRRMIFILAIDLLHLIFVNKFQTTLATLQKNALKMVQPQAKTLSQLKLD